MMETENQIEIYENKESGVSLQVKFEGDTVWLSQSQLSELFKQTKQNISLHINNCFKEGELDSFSVVKNSLTTAADGKKYKTKYYNLDVIISVGYRVKSKQGTPFRSGETALRALQIFQTPIELQNLFVERIEKIEIQKQLA